MKYLFLCLAFSACGGGNLVATFTSDVVQRRICRVVGERPEACEREEITLGVRATLIEEDDGVRLVGVPVSASDGILFGSKTNQGDYLFTTSSERSNTEDDCTIVETLVLSLAVDPNADRKAIGSDDCIALVGRETRTTEISAACDDINEVPLPVTRILRRRWERSPTCE